MKCLKDCTAQFFLYYVSLHHIHSDYWHESFQTQLAKVRACLQSALEDCSSNVIKYVMKIFAGIIMIDIPDIREAIGTRFSSGNDTVWCTVTPRINWVTVPIREIDEIVPAVTERFEIRPTAMKYQNVIFPPTSRYNEFNATMRHVVYSIPGPKTEMYNYPAFEKKHEQHLDTTPVEDFYIPLTQGYVRAMMPPQYSIGQEHYTQNEFQFQDRVTPTVSYIRDFAPQVNPQAVNFALPPTKTARYYPAPFYVAQHVTPSTYQTERAMLPYENFTIAMELPFTRRWWHTAHSGRYQDRIYPTRVEYQYISPPGFEYEDSVPRPYTRKVDYQAEYEQFNENMPAKPLNWERFAVPREKYRFTLAPWPTVMYHQKPNYNVYHQFMPMGPTKRIAVIPQVKTIWEDRPLTTAKLYVKQPRIQKLQDEAKVVTQVIKQPPSYGFCQWIEVKGEVLTIEEIAKQSGCKPISLECRAILTQQDYRDIGQKVTCDVIRGFICRDSDQSSVCNPAIKDRCCCYKYEVRCLCEERIFESRLRPTTVGKVIIIPELKRKIEHEIIPLPFTRKVIYHPEQRIIIDQIPQTTVRDIEMPVAKRTVHHVYPGAPTSVYRYTAVEKQIEKYFIPTTQRMSLIKQRPRVFVDNRGYAVTRKYHWGRTDGMYEERRKIPDMYIVPHKPKVQDYAVDLPTTEVYKYDSKCNNFGPWIRVGAEHISIQEILSKSGGCDKLKALECRTVETREDCWVVGQNVTCDIHNGFTCRHIDQKNVCYQIINNTCTCYDYEVRIQHCVYRERWTQPPPLNVYFPAEVVRDRKTMLPPRTVVEYYPQKSRLYTGHVIPTKAIIIRIPRPSVDYVQRATQTTARLYVKQPKAQFIQNEVAAPVTKIYRFTPAPRIYQEHEVKIDPRIIYIKNQGTKIYEDRYIPGTRIWRYTKPPKIHVFRWTRTTVRDQFVPLTKRVHHQVYKNMPTRIAYFTQHEQFIRRRFFPTIIRYFTIPIKEQVIIQYQEATTQRWFIPEITRNIIVERVPLPPTQVIQFRPTERIHTDIKKQTTAKLIVKQPKVESIVNEGQPPGHGGFSPWMLVEIQCSTSLTIEEILRRIPECTKVREIQCRTYNDKIDVTIVNQVLTCDTQHGFICRASDQRYVCNRTITSMCCCNSYEVRVRCVSRDGYGELVTQQPIDDMVPLKKRIYGQVLPPDVPKLIHRPSGCLCKDMEVRIECCTKSYTEIIHPPKIIIRYTPPDRNFEESYHLTTVQSYIKRPPVKYYTRELGVQTRRYHIRPQGCLCIDMTVKIECCEFEQHIYPTVVNRVWEKPKTKQQWEVMPLPQTKIWEMKNKPTARMWKYFPSTVQDVYIPQQRDNIHIAHPNIPPNRVEYPPKSRWYTDQVVPQPTVVWNRTPSIRRFWENVPHPPYNMKLYPVTTDVYEEEREAHTRVERYTQPDREEECRFPPPKMRTVTSCYTVTRAREICSSEWLEYWCSSIRNCSLQRFHRRGFTLEFQLSPTALQCLQEALAVCIRIIGDTNCRDDKFSLMKWVFEREIIVVGRLGERGQGHFHTNTSDELKKCVVLTNENSMNACYPGFRNILVDLLLNGKGNLSLNVDKCRDPSCLIEEMKHCQTSDLQTLEELVYSTFGTCIKMCPSSDGTRGCVDYTLRSKYCTSADVKRFAQDVKKCIKELIGQMFGEHQKKIGIFVRCLKTNPLDCVMSAWTVFRDVILFITRILGKNEDSNEEDSSKEENWYKGKDYSYQESGKKDYCSEQFTLENLKPCCQNLIAITSTLQDARTGMNKETMRSVANCFRKSLDACSPDVCEGFLSVLENVCNTAYLTNSDNDYPSYSYRSVNSVKVFGDELNICESEYQEDIDYDTNPDVTPVAENGSSVKYVIQRSCRGYDIGKWMNATKFCMTEQTKKIGLKNPDSLTIERIIHLLQSCIIKQGNLKCHPKGRKEYRLLLSSFFNIVRRFSVVSNSSTCQQDLIIENIGKCQNSLYSFLLLKYESSVTKDKKAALDCLRKSFKNCSAVVIENVLRILDDAIYPNNSAPIYSQDYTVCEPSDPAFDNTRNKCEFKLLKKGYFGRKVIYRAKNYNDTEKFYYGPTPSLLELKKMDENKGLNSDMNTSDSKIIAMDLSEFSKRENWDENDTHSTLNFRQMNEDYGFQTPQRENNSMFYESVTYCSSYHYRQYFETILNCQSIRMNALLYFEGTNCGYEWMEKSLESLMRCLMEDKKYLLPCQIHDEKQVHDYLEFLSEKLDSSRRFKGENCSAVKACYGTDIPQLSTCSNVIHKQLSDKVLPVLTERGLSETLDCLKNVWPYCSSDMSLLTLPSIYVPFGIDLKEILKETEDTTCLSAKIRSSDSECTSLQKHSATKEIYDCLDRTIKRINDSLNVTTEKLHWQVIPLTVCVMMHPILECKQNNQYEFKEFMKEFLEGIKMKLNMYLNIFDEPSDIQQGKICIEQFSSPSIDSCLSTMFGYMTSFHTGFSKSTDYPFQCVEDSFKDCGDINTFHLFMKKTMNVSENDNEKTNEVTVAAGEEICFKKEKYGLGLHSCFFEDFEVSLRPLTECQLQDEQNSTAQNALKLCKNCVLNEVDDMCFYNHHDFTNVVTSAFKPISKCLKKLKVNDYCIQDLTNGIKGDCMSRFNEYALSLKKGTILKATQLANDFYRCLKETITQCPSDIFKNAFNAYSKISGLEIISIFQSA